MKHLLLFLSCACALQAQDAQVTGFVRDPSAAVVARASVVIKNVDTGVEHSSVTNESGLYTIPTLQPGNYLMTVTAPGFQTSVRDQIVLNVAQSARLDVGLQVGRTEQSVTVSGGTTMVNTESAVVATVVDRQFMENMPLNGRSFQSLLLLTPGIVPTANVLGANIGGSFSVNGQRPASNGFMVDGVNANFAASPAGFNNFQTSGNLPALSVLGTTQTLASVDAVQEFKVQTSTYSAEFGPQPGAQISIITRSGTNAYHGSGFEYVRNDKFDANDWFANRAIPASPKPPERQNDFGGTFGGPVRVPHVYDGRNRTFFFASYEGLRLRLPQFTLSNVPSLCARGMGGCVGNVSDGTPHRAVNASLLPLMKAFPIPNGRDLNDGLAEYSAGYSNPSTINTTGIRLDHTIGSKLTLFGRYNRSPSSQESRSASNLASISHSSLDTWTLTVGATSTLSARMTNEFRLNRSSNNTDFSSYMGDFGGAVPIPRTALLPAELDGGRGAASLTLQAFPGSSVTPYPSISIPGPLIASQHQFNIVDNFSWIKGSHRLKFGGTYRHVTPVVQSYPYNLLALMQNEVQLLNGVTGPSIIQSALPSFPVFNQYSAFAQDTWKITRRLTIDYGIRWDYIPPPSERNGNLGVTVDQITNLATMKLLPLGSPAWNPSRKNVGPRLGMAYQLSQKPGHETVIRGGFGVFYDSGNDRSTQNSNRFPYAVNKTVLSLSFPLQTAQAASTPVPTPLTTPYPAMFAFDPNLQLPYTLQWNVAVEQSLGTSQALTVSYIGAAARNLVQGTTLSLAAINKAFTSVTVQRNTASSDYNALQAQFQRRLKRGLQALVSYTWAHALDDDSDSNSGRVATRGNAAFDVRQVFASALTYDIPAPGNDPIVRAILGHWSFDSNFHAQTAPPVDLVASTIVDPTNGDTINVRPNVVLGVPWYLDDPHVPGGRKINAAAFATPAAGKTGNLGRNQVRGFGVWQEDFAVRRQFRLQEKLRMQVRAEAFNIFNHPNFGFSPSLNGNIPTNLTSPTFGQPTTMLNRSIGGMSQLYQIGGPRSLQFAMKLMF